MLILAKLKFNKSKSERIIDYMILIIFSPDSNKPSNNNNIEEDVTRLVFFEDYET